MLRPFLLYRDSVITCTITRRPTYCAMSILFMPSCS